MLAHTGEQVRLFTKTLTTRIHEFPTEFSQNIIFAAHKQSRTSHATYLDEHAARSGHSRSYSGARSAD